VITIKSPLANAINGPEWLPHGVGPELPVDQRAEDEGSVCFDSAELGAELIICGAPRLKLRLRSDRSVGIVCVRLTDLFEDGQAAQISYGLLNLLHRDGLHQPKPVTPNEWFDVEVLLSGYLQDTDCESRFPPRPGPWCGLRPRP
jgi:predicted acyl esterase